MKCPKCGYNSFEYYDFCKKCANDLSGYKQTYGITPIILPLEAQKKMAEEFRAAREVSDQPSENVETPDDMFSFDLPEDSSPAVSVSRSIDPFSFIDNLLDAGQKQAKAEEDAFADLLESTSQAATSPRTIPKSAVPASVPGEYDLENFSWDEPAASDGNGEKAAADDFDSLFGDTKKSAPK